MDCATAAGGGGGDDQSKVSDVREQILQLAWFAFHEEEEKRRTEIQEKLSKCNKDTLVELCRSFDIPGSKANRKEELVATVMEFLKEHCSGIDGTTPNKKIKRRRRKREGENLSGGKPSKGSKRKKSEGTALETQDEEEADESKGEEDRMNYSEYDLKDNRSEYVNNMEGQFPKEEPNPEPSGRINGSASENLGGVTLTEMSIPTKEQAVATIPSAKLVSTIEGDTTDMKASRKKNTSITRKKVTPNSDHKDKSCGKRASKGDVKPRKQLVKPSRDELRQAVFFILDRADFATMTFGEVVKEVDKYFGKDLSERKPLIRSLIEEELFRLAEEAEMKELKEEEAAEAKARAEQDAKERTKVAVLELGTDKANELQAGQGGKSKDAAQNGNGNSVEKGFEDGIFVVAAENRNSSDAAESLQDGKAEAGTKNEDSGDEFTNDSKVEKVVENVNSGDGVEGSTDGKAEKVNKNDKGDAIGCSEDGKNEEADSEENDNTEDGRTEEGRHGNGVNNAENANNGEAEGPDSNENGEHVECAQDGKAQEANNNEKGENVVFHGTKDGKLKEAMEIVNTEQRQTDASDDGRAEDAEQIANTKVDVDSSKDGTDENEKTDNDAEANSVA